MADTRDITITIVNTDYSEDIFGDDNKGKAINPAPKNKNTEKEVSAATKFAKAASTLIALSGAKQLIENTIEVSLSRYYNMSEDYISQNDYRNVMTAIGKTTSLASTVIGGVTSGLAFGGAVGGAIGGIVAGAGWGLSEAINMKATRSQYYSQINASNINMAYMQQRAGLYMNGKGTEN